MSGLLAQPQSAGEVDTLFEVQQWVRKHAYALETVEPLSGLEDLEPLREIVGDARIVGLGESTHGSREFFQLRHRMLEFLVREMGFNVFAIEASLPEAMDINRYVVHGEGNPERALAGLYFWTCDTREMLAIIEWMRAYNSSRPDAEKVKFYGFDMQSATRPAKEFVSFLLNVDPVAHKRAVRVLEPLLDPFTSRKINWTWSEDERQVLRDSLVSVVADFEKQLERYADSVGLEEADIARCYLEILQMFLGVNDISRDEAMAENVKWILEHEGPGSKAVLWDHNRHIANEQGWQGHYLKEMYGDDYCAIGFAFDRGGFQSRNVLTDGVLEPFYVGNAPDTTFEAVIRDAVPDVALLDYGLLPGEGPVCNWFHSIQNTRSIGSGYTHDHPEWYIWKMAPAEVFDVLAFVRETTPAQATTSGQRVGTPPPVSHPANMDFETGHTGKWPLGWIRPRGVALLEWDVQITNAHVHTGKKAVSIRRAPGPNYGETHASLSQRVDAVPWQGKTVSLRVWARIEGSSRSDRGHIWIQVTAPGPYYSDMVKYETIHIPPSGWKEHLVEVEVPENADVIEFGFAFSGKGVAYIDSFSLD